MHSYLTVGFLPLDTEVAQPYCYKNPSGCEGSEQAVSPGNRMKPPEVNGKTDSSITLLGMHQALREYLLSMRVSF